MLGTQEVLTKVLLSLLLPVKWKGNCLVEGQSLDIGAQDGPQEKGLGHSGSLRGLKGKVRCLAGKDGREGL